MGSAEGSTIYTSAEYCHKLRSLHNASECLQWTNASVHCSSCTRMQPQLLAIPVKTFLTFLPRSQETRGIEVLLWDWHSDAVHRIDMQHLALSASRTLDLFRPRGLVYIASGRGDYATSCSSDFTGFNCNISFPHCSHISAGATAVAQATIITVRTIMSTFNLPCG